MKIGFFRTDMVGFNYIVPEEEVKEFDRLNTKICGIKKHTDAWYILKEKFDSLYDQYFTNDVELSHKKVIMD